MTPPWTTTAIAPPRWRPPCSVYSQQGRRRRRHRAAPRRPRVWVAPVVRQVVQRRVLDQSWCCGRGGRGCSYACHPLPRRYRFGSLVSARWLISRWDSTPGRARQFAVRAGSSWESERRTVARRRCGSVIARVRALCHKLRVAHRRRRCQWHRCWRCSMRRPRPRHRPWALTWTRQLRARRPRGRRARTRSTRQDC